MPATPCTFSCRLFVRILPNNIYNVDCLKGMESIASSSIDMILSDLPYGLTGNKWDVRLPFEALWGQYLRILKPTGVVALTACQPFTSLLVVSQIQLFRHEWIWIKNCGSNFGNVHAAPMREHESILIFSRGKWTYNKQMQARTASGASRSKYLVDNTTHSSNYSKFQSKGDGIAMRTPLRCPSSCQSFNREVGLHPTQKPVALFEYLIRTYSNPKELVLDNCIGSGTTAVACLNADRRYIGFEVNPDYFRIAQERIQRHQVGVPMRREAELHQDSARLL